MTTAGATRPLPRGSLLRHHDFMLLWGGQSISGVGSTITPFAVPFFAVTALHASSFAVGVLTALGSLAALLVSLPAGVVVDRVRRRRLMIWCDGLRAVTLCTIPVAWLFDALSLIQLGATVVVTGVLTVFFDVAYQSYLPGLVDRESLLEANAKLGTTAAAATTLGPSLAGALVAVMGAARAVVADAASFAASAVSLALIRTPDEPPERPLHPGAGMRAQIGEGLRFVVGHPILRGVVACTATVNFFGTAAGAMEMPFLIRDLRLSAGGAGLLLAIGAVGGVVGGLLAGHLARLVGSARIIWVAPLVLGLPTVVTPLAYPGPRVGLYALGWFAFSLWAVVYNTAQVSYRQRVCPPELLGRMNATIRWIVWGTIPLGALLGGAIASAFGLRAALWVGMTGALLGGLFVLGTPLRHLRDIDAD